MEVTRPGQPLQEPWRTAVEGKWEAAASAFEGLGWPFERARELASSGDDDTMVEALMIYDRLGASATAALLRRQLQQEVAAAVGGASQPDTNRSHGRAMLGGCVRWRT